MKPTILLSMFLLGLPGVHAQQAAQQAAPADKRAPDQVLKETIANVMEAIRSDPAAAGDPDGTYRAVQKHFLPSTDFLLTTQYAVGGAWARATPAQREALFREFQILLARTYAMQLTQIQGQETRFKIGVPARPSPGASDAVVKTTVATLGDTMAIDYRMRRTDAGWKIYDINMMGAWMIQVYRQQFAGQLAHGGIDGLIKYLAAHNQAG
jgi:ABC-type transporter MlaC component